MENPEFLNRQKIVRTEINLVYKNLREILTQLEWLENTIVMRVFSIDRLPHFLRNGTDRDPSSPLYTFREDRPAYQVEEIESIPGYAAKVTYARLLDLTSAPVTTLDFLQKPFQDLSAQLEERRQAKKYNATQLSSYIAGLDPKSAIVFYDPKEAVVGLIVDSSTGD